MHDFVVIHVVPYVQQHLVIFNEVFYYLNSIYYLQSEWESVFNKVLFPLLLKLLETTNITDHVHGIEETRVRVSQLLCRIFLQHLSPLLTLPTFTALWLTILDFMDRYLKSDQTDMLVRKLNFSFFLEKFDFYFSVNQFENH